MKEKNTNSICWHLKVLTSYKKSFSMFFFFVNTNTYVILGNPVRFLQIVFLKRKQTINVDISKFWVTSKSLSPCYCNYRKFCVSWKPCKISSYCLLDNEKKKYFTKLAVNNKYRNSGCTNRLLVDLNDFYHLITGGKNGRVTRQDWVIFKIFFSYKNYPPFCFNWSDMQGVSKVLISFNLAILHT